MKSAQIFLITIVIFLAIGSSHASSLSASFNLLNGSASINQSIAFNVSAYFPIRTNYTIFLNNSAILFGNVPANYSGYRILDYNVGRLPSGMYRPSIYFSSFSFHLNATQDLNITAYPDFTFVKDYGITEIIKNYSVIDVIVKNSGNTPLRINWSLPILRNITISLDFKQSFPLDAGANMTIPINLSLQEWYQKSVSFAFTGTHGDYSSTKYYSTLLVRPSVNMSFYGINVTGVNSTRELWTSSIKNYNNIPLNVTLQFLLDVNGSSFYYNTSYYIGTNTTEIEVYLPKSSVENVKIFYPSGNLSYVKQTIFSPPSPPAGVNIYSVINTFGYAVLTAASILILLSIHLRMNRKRRKK